MAEGPGLQGVLTDLVNKTDDAVSAAISVVGGSPFIYR
jgi:hypothetical protein